MPRRILFLLILVFLLAGCATTPTGRHQLQLLSQSKVDQMGDQAYTQLKQKQPISHDPQINQFADCVARHITAVANAQSGKDRHWNVTVFKSDQANAFALPGGNIGVYTGILKYARTQGQLAAVLGHETGHVLAHHVNARMSASEITQTGVGIASIFLGGGNPATQRQALGLLGLGAQVGILLPFSRSQESEADEIGLYNMARAGFDPRQAVQLWQHFSAGNQKTPPVFLSDHPGNGQRIQGLESHMDKALRLYRQAREAGRDPQCGPAPPAPSAS